MAIANSNSVSNTFLTRLDQALSNLSATNKWIVIAHDDEDLVAALKRGLDTDAVALIRIKQSDWAFHQTEFVDAICWALSQFDIDHILLAGHSDPEMTGELAHPDRVGGTDSIAEFRERLVRGTTMFFEKSQKSRRAFADQLAALCAIDAVEERMEEDRLVAYGLYYRYEAGLFSLVENTCDEQTFRPI